MNTATESQTQMKRGRWRLSTLIPLAIFLIMVVFLGIGLTMDPRLIPSPLIGKQVPEFSLSPVKGRELGLKTSDLKEEVSMVNVFASWCTACRQEHPLLLSLSRRGVVPIHGLNYKDQPDDAAAWLDKLGDPYTRTGADRDGMVGIDWGVYGVPETFIVDKQGNIVYKHIGPIQEKDWKEKLLPLIVKLQRQPPAPFPGADK